jgi:hypothetical protein
MHQWADDSADGKQGDPGHVARGPSATFYVGVGIGPFVGGGKLTIAPSAIVLEPDRPTRLLIRVSRIVHTDRQVTLVKARLVPPWFNTSVVLHDEHASGYAATWLGARHRLCASLKDAGFGVQEVRTWFSLTGGGAASSRVRNSSWASGGLGRRELALATSVGAVTAVLVVSHSAVFIAFAAACIALSHVPLFRR